MSKYIFIINKITNIQRLAALSILTLSLLLIIMLINMDKLTEIAFNVVLSICASVLYFRLYSAVAKNKECEEIALLAIGKLNPSYPVKFYEASNTENPSFSNDIENELKKNFSEKLYYEGITIKTFCKCIVNSFSSFRGNTYPECYFIISKASLLDMGDFKELLISIMNLWELCKNRKTLQLSFCILNYHPPFHIHLTDRCVWFSPFKGNNTYPTTFLYEKNDSENSYYRNLKSMIKRTIKSNEKNIQNLYGTNSHGADEKIQLIELLKRLEVKKYIQANRKYFTDCNMLDKNEIDNINDKNIIPTIEKIIK